MEKKQLSRQQVTYAWTSVTKAQAHAHPPITVFLFPAPQQPPNKAKEKVKMTCNGGLRIRTCETIFDGRIHAQRVE